MRRGISCSYAFLGICEAIFRGRDRVFCVEPHISIYVFNGYQIIFLFGQPGACSKTSSLTIFIAFTSYSGAGHPGAGSNLFKLKKIFDILDMMFHTKN